MEALPCRKVVGDNVRGILLYPFRDFLQLGGQGKLSWHLRAVIHDAPEDGYRAGFVPWYTVYAPFQQKGQVLYTPHMVCTRQAL